MKAEEIYNRFVSRKEIFAMQHLDGTYTPVRREITIEDIEKHLQGEKTYGVYVVDSNNMVKFGVIDSDKPEQYPKMLKIYASLLEKQKELGIGLMFEESGTDGHTHIWVFKDIYFADMRKILQTELQKVGLVEGRDARAKKDETEFQKALRIDKNKRNVELFPKNKEPLKPDQVGFLIKLPLSFHQREKKWSKILYENFDS